MILPFIGNCLSIEAEETVTPMSRDVISKLKKALMSVGDSCFL